METLFFSGFAMKSMPIKFSKLNPEIETPKYHSAEAAGFDIASAEDLVIKPGEAPIIKTGIVIQAPEGHFLLLAARSSLPVKKGLMLANGVGILDRDYCGPDDEIKIQVYNFTNHDVAVAKGERIAQGIFMPAARGEFTEAARIKETSRGSHGSTGGYNA